jgi:hypothetical protein
MKEYTNMQQFSIHLNNDPKEDQSKLLNSLKVWLDESSARNKPIKWKGIHDEGTFLTAWREYFRLTNDPLVDEFAQDMLSKSNIWAKKHLVDGYHKIHEVHHGVEHFIIFLPWMLELDSESPIAKEQLVNAAKHICKTEPAKKTWYDFERKRFQSLYLGSKKVRQGFEINIVEHLRLIRLAWLGAYSGGDDSLKRIIKEYSKEWTDQILNNNMIPVYLDSDNVDSKKFQLALKLFIGAAPKELTQKSRSEFHIANGTPDLFMNLYEATQDRSYLDAAEKIVTNVKDQLLSPYSHPIGDLLWRLNQLGRKADISAEQEKVDQLIEVLSEKSLSLEFIPKILWKQHRLYNTVGIRKDMPEVVIKDLEGSQTYVLPSPATLGLFYRISGNPKYLLMGLNFATAVFNEARSLYPDGREHGCSANQTHSFCVGHGRDWGAGFVSTILRAAEGPTTHSIALPKLRL